MYEVSLPQSHVHHPVQLCRRRVPQKGFSQSGWQLWHWPAVTNPAGGRGEPGTPLSTACDKYEGPRFCTALFCTMQDSQMNTCTLFAQLLAQQLADSCSGTVSHIRICAYYLALKLCATNILLCPPKKAGRNRNSHNQLLPDSWGYFSLGGAKFFLFFFFLPSSSFDRVPWDSGITLNSSSASSQSWDYRHAPPYGVYAGLGVWSRSS